MSRMEKLLNAVKAANSNSSFNKEDQKEFYYPARDQSGNGSAVIRFLPGKTDDDIPFVKTYSHGFKGPSGKWYIEDCPTTIGQPCYCCEQNGALIAPFGDWKSAPNTVKDTVRERKRRMQYVANIVVIKDEKNPENEGKIFLFKFGQKIADKLFGMIAPTFVDEDEHDDFVKKFGGENVDVFDLKKGANFSFKIRKVEGQTNYDKSEFRAPSELDTDVDLNTLEDLEQFTAPDKFKSPEDLKKRFDAAVGNTIRLAAKAEVEADEEEPVVVAKPSPKPATKVVEADEDDDVAAMMRRLSEQDD